MRVVLDTNVIVSYVVGSQGAPKRIWELLMSGDVTLGLTLPLFDELVTVLARQKLQKYLVPSLKIEVLTKLSVWVNTVPKQPLHVSRDPKDNMVLEAAIAAHAACIITGDEDLRVLHPFQGIEILSPAEFLQQKTEASQ